MSTFILIIIGFGLWQRRRPKVHIPLMVTAFVLDVLLVLYIEATRHAIETVGIEIVAPKHDGLLIFHVSVSLLTILLYIALIITGMKLYKGDWKKRDPHRTLAAAFILSRVANYVTSFWVAS